MIFRYPRLPSTMTEAARLADLGFPPGTVVLADEQTEGQGRFGRAWYSPAKEGLYCSILLEHQPVLTLALGLAVRQAVRFIAAVECDLRWPNDLLIGEKKAAGILVQLYGSQAIAGIGVNLSQTAFPADLAEVATSLRMETGRLCDREDLLCALLDAVSASRAWNAETVLRLFSERSSYVEGKRVSVEQGEETIRGVTAGLDEQGYLRVRRESGEVVTVLAGGVRSESA